MAFSEFETKEYERIVHGFVEKRRPPPHIRHEVDLGYRLKNQSVEIFEIRDAVKARPSFLGFHRFMDAFHDHADY